MDTLNKVKTLYQKAIKEHFFSYKHGTTREFDFWAGKVVAYETVLQTMGVTRKDINTLRDEVENKQEKKQ